MHHPLGDRDLGIFLKLTIRHADSITRGQVFGREELEMTNEWSGRVGCRTEWMFFFLSFILAEVWGDARRDHHPGEQPAGTQRPCS